MVTPLSRYLNSLWLNRWKNPMTDVEKRGTDLQKRHFKTKFNDVLARKSTTLNV